MSTILVVDDEKDVTRQLSIGLKMEGYNALTAQSGEEALDIIAKHEVDLVLLDIIMPAGMDGHQTLIKLKELKPDLTVIMLSAQVDTETAAKSITLGAKGYIAKPIELKKILSTLKNHLDFSRMQKENAELRKQVWEKYEMIGESRAMQEIYAQIRLAAPSEGRVLITGENGTGKELVAHAIHQNSARRDKPFIRMNCAAIPEDLIESELFGHEKGAFTGASSQRRGRFELADGGTLFLDEVGDMSLKTQAKVLRVLEVGEFESVGGIRTIKVNVRVIAASNKDLQKEIEEGRFREDLFYRLNVIPIHVPPLRERKEDIPLLVEHFVRWFQKDSVIKPKMFNAEAMETLQNYDWRGNVRELKNIVERLLIMVDRETITVEDVAPILGVTEKESSIEISEDQSLKEMVGKAEEQIILEALEANDWNVSQTARQLKIERSNFYKKLKKYNILPERSGSEQ